MNLSGIKKLLLNNKSFNRFSSGMTRLWWNNKTRIRGKNNTISFANTYLKKCRISVSGTDNQIDFCSEKSGTVYFENCRFIIHGNHNRILIDDRVTAYHATFIIEDDNNTIQIGYKTLFAGQIEIACTESCKILIGEQCLFSSGIDIRSGDSHSIMNSEGQRINHGKDIIIHDHIWIGRRAMVLKGSEIQSHSVVGAGAIVTSRFEKEHLAIAGVPARIIKEGIDWQHER